jgi:hypothetical protein
MVMFQVWAKELAENHRLGCFELSPLDLGMRDGGWGEKCQVCARSILSGMCPVRTIPQQGAGYSFLDCVGLSGVAHGPLSPLSMRVG